jgi:hypothetical protein
MALVDVSRQRGMTVGFGLIASTFAGGASTVGSGGIPEAD